MLEELEIMHEAIYMVVGAFLSGIVGIGIVSFARWRTRIADRNNIYRAIEAEINQNQDMIMGIIDTHDEWFPGYPNEKESALELDELLKIIDFYKKAFFQNNIFMGLRDKLGLLNSKTIECLFHYYISLSAVELTLSVWIAARYGTKDEQRRTKELKESFVKCIEKTYQEGENMLEHIRKERTSTKRFYIGRPKDK